MVRLRGPLFSDAAAGQLNNTLIFRAAGRGHTAYQYFKPKQPETAAQTARRLIFRWLSQQWPVLTTAEAETWIQPAQHENQHPINAFLQHNLQRWTNFEAPVKRKTTDSYPWTGHTILMRGTGLPAAIRWTLYCPWYSAPWAYVLWRSPNPRITRRPNNVTRIFFVPGECDLTYLDMNVPAGKQYAKLSIFGADGTWYHHPGECSATAT